MTGTELVALGGLVSTTTVALVAPIIASRLEARRQSAERQAQRIDELRSVLDGGTIALSKAQHAIFDAGDMMEAWLAQPAGAEAKAKKAAGKAVARLRQNFVEISEFEDRLAVRIRPTVAWEEFRGANLVISNFGKACEDLLKDPDGEEPSAAGFLESLEERYTELRDAKMAYQLAATTMVGPDRE